MSTPNVLIVLTSNDKLGDTGNKTGYWLEEFASPYYTIRDAGANVEIVSVLGGKPPVDPGSTAEQWLTEDTEKLEKDEAAQAQLASTKSIEEVKASDYDGIFFPGGHGPLWDFPGNATLANLIEDFDRQDKPIGSVCHGTVALVDVKNTDGTPIVKGKKISAFTNTEEEGVQLTNVVPFLLEDKFKELGANYERGDDFTSFTVTDGNLVTGQNPQSSVATAKAFMALVK